VSDLVDIVEKISEEGIGGDQKRRVKGRSATVPIHEPPADSCKPEAGTHDNVEKQSRMEEAMTENTNRGVQAPEGAREWLSQMQQLSEQIHKQQHNSQQMMQELMNTYLQLLSTPGSYASGQAEQQQQTLQQLTQQWMEQAQQQQQTFQQQAQQQQQSFQQMVQESMNTYLQMFNIPHSYLQEGMRLAQQDAPGTPQERSGGGDPKEDQYRESAKQSSE
jgi:signal transduction histidine kinase